MMGKEDTVVGDESATSRLTRQNDRRNAITEAVMAAGSIRIADLAERFGTSTMTVHRDLDELESRGLLRKDRGIATALSTGLVESSDVYRASRELSEKRAIALAALEFIEPGQSIMLDDSTTVLHLVPHLHERRPLTVITNTLTVMNELRSVTGVTLLGLGGQYYNWCSAYMGRLTTETISHLRADVLVMSTSAITDGVAFHQTMETVDVKRAMFDAASTRILLADHTKFDKRALHAMQPLADFDAVIVDAGTDKAHIAEMRRRGINVVIAPRTRAAS
ncbi:DeoR family transcriptional regulator [Microbacterium sorbitolivorans]|uniref:DeoR/GlpR transcriptional regulator n=1 Tax=Microbacterium sorbitolivorans TaxID=1867410 RepID=A0A367Y2H7_9MICO|nr:DeoR/GlpR family DNA-binding transcription regulator [Microbacterium sorbitolivorans]RCK59829.1 DeoR/GlpR transcriptional regulator [Microbacterium sorbitolivorans]GGF40354.1 DeoR family transcriptional regulator [Microbacterium sorbitolivorans]